MASVLPSCGRGRRRHAVWGLAWLIASLLGVAGQAGSAPPDATPSPAGFTGYRIDHHAIGVDDFDGMVRWYSDVLGFRVEKTWTVAELPEARLAYLLGPGHYRIELIGGGGGPRMPSGASFEQHFGVRGYNHICFWVDDIDGTALELQRRGAALFFPPTDFPVGAERRIFLIKDPEGNVIEFAGPLNN